MLLKGSDYLILLSICSVATGLITQALKQMTKELKKQPKPNMIAAIVSVIVGVVVPLLYFYATGQTFSGEVVISIIITVILSWLCSMLGYDKIAQTIAQMMSFNGKPDLQNLIEEDKEKEQENKEETEEKKE